MDPNEQFLAPTSFLGLRLSRDFYQRDTVTVAKQLLGKRLFSWIAGKLVTGQIVETEAYLPKGDPACHCVRGRTASNNSMFEQAGTSYVYPIHARYCFNVATQGVSEGTAVLIRAVRPEQGLATMFRRRGVERMIDLCRGPARLCESFGIDRAEDGLDLVTCRQLWIGDSGEPVVAAKEMERTPRIGVTSAKERLLRFALKSNRWVSGPANLRRHK